MKILILASNPRKDLNLDREIRDLKDVIAKSRNRAELEVEVGLAVRVGDLQDLLFQHQPQIVHFSGHGSGAEGLALEGEEGGERRVRADALAGLFRLFPGVSCVLLNACYSEEQAEAIVTHIDYVIGMRQTIRDDAAIAFSKGFYRALGYACSIEQSYDVGCNAIQLEISGSSKVLRSAVSEQQRKLEVVTAIATTALEEHQKPILKKKVVLSGASGFIPTETLVALQVEVDKALEEEDSSLRKYREQVREYLADRQIEPFEQVMLDQLRDELGLSVEETDRILAEEQAPIWQARRAYEQRLTALIQFYPFNAAIVAELKRFQERRNLTDAEVAEISQPIFAAAEAAHRASLEEQAALQAALQAAQEEQEQGEKRQRYRQEFYRATEAAYPIADSIRLALKSFQQQIGLSDTAAASIEQPILERLEAEYQERLRQRESDRLVREAEERQRREQAEQAESDRLRREAQERQQAEAVRQAEADRREAQERQRRQAEADRRRREAEQTPSTPTQSFYSPPTSPSAPPTPAASNWSRRRVIRTAGLAALGVAGTGIAVTGGRLLQQQPSSTQPSSTPSTLKTDSVTVNDKGEVVDRHPVQSKGFAEDLGNSIRLEMVQIPGGKFLMGSPDGEKQRESDESPQHQVTVSPFAIGKFEVTQAQWKAIASNLPKVKIDLKADPSNFKGSDRPVEQVSWDEAIEFCDRLSVKTGKKCRLPSEAEWEYACRAGTTTPFNFGETTTTDLANYRGTDWKLLGKTYLGFYGQGPRGSYRSQTIAVGSFPPNAFGLYDMHGNVWEWCADYYHGSYQGAPTDGSAWVEGGDRTNRMLRGGSWSYDPRICRSANRNWLSPDLRLNGIGFRVCLPFREDLT